MTKAKDDATDTKHHEAAAATGPAVPAPPPRKCGLVMPISAMDGILASHWQDVKAIVIDALPDWNVSLVSDGDDAGVIQQRIVERLYKDDMVIVDVSARNPNVMFELGMRLAFDKPTVIVKDEVTIYPFDVAPNEFVDYPRDLRFQKIVEFQKRLAMKVEATARPGHITYLKNFGPFKIAKIETQEVAADSLILERLDRLEGMIARLAIKQETTDTPSNRPYREISPVDRATIYARVRKRILEQMVAFGVKDASEDIASAILAECGPTASSDMIADWCRRNGFLRRSHSRPPGPPLAK